MENNAIDTYKEIIAKNIKCGEYKKKEDMLKLIKYITGNSASLEVQKTVRYIGAYGVPYYNPELCRDAMYIVKKYYDKMDKIYKTGKPLRSVNHFMISFKDYINDANIIKLIAIDICDDFYKNGFQCIYGVHEDTDNLHMHIAVNGTNFMTTKQLHLSNWEFKVLPKYLNKRTYELLKEKDC